MGRSPSSPAPAAASDAPPLFALSPGLVRTDMTADIPWVQTLPDSAFTPIETGAEPIVRLARGDADILGGMLIHALDDLDALLAESDALRAGGRYQLRLFRALDDPDPV